VYDYLVGEVAAKGPGYVVLEAGGIGYRLTVTPRCAERIAVNGTAKLYAHFHVREDEHRLYGFSAREERDAFECLLGASGVGPALAIQILSHLSPAELRRAVVAEDVKRISGAKGVGQKTARKIVLDLKSVLEKRLDFEAGAPPAGEFSPRRARPREEALRALVALGLTESSAATALAKVAEPDGGEAESRSVETLVRLALSPLYS